MAEKEKPIFVATHPRACSTAFERVFMTRKDILKCVHEPFGDAYYYGPERMADRFMEDEQARLASGKSECTYKSVFDDLLRDNPQGKRLFLKDMAQYLVPPNNQPAYIAPSLSRIERGIGTDTPSSGSTATVDTGDSSLQVSLARSPVLVNVPGTFGLRGDCPYPFPTEGEPGNPTVVPEDILGCFHFAFLIRHPSRSVPSYFRCTEPPLVETTGWHGFLPSEAGYAELRRLFDHLRETGQIGPSVAGQTNGTESQRERLTDTSNVASPQICVIDADDLLDKPAEVLQVFCESVGIDFRTEMLNWNSSDDQEYARQQFEKWRGFHDDALYSKDLKPRSQPKRVKTLEECYQEWASKYGHGKAKIIQETVNANLEHYNYLKQFAVKV